MLKEAKSSKIAKGLVVLSLNEEGRVEPEKINNILTELKKEPARRALPILRNFLTLIKQHINTYEGSIEKFDSNVDFTSNLISDNISKARGKKINLVIKENKSLVAGFRVRIGDDVYEDTIASRIARLKKSLT
jgi:F-type H+-transporting ATPase subunit delta